MSGEGYTARLIKGMAMGMVRLCNGRDNHTPKKLRSTSFYDFVPKNSRSWSRAQDAFKI